MQRHIECTQSSLTVRYRIIHNEDIHAPSASPRKSKRETLQAYQLLCKKFIDSRLTGPQEMRTVYSTLNTGPVWWRGFAGIKAGVDGKCNNWLFCCFWLFLHCTSCIPNSHLRGDVFKVPLITDNYPHQLKKMPVAFHLSRSVFRLNI